MRDVKVTVTCDHCGKPPSDVYGALMVKVRSEREELSDGFWPYPDGLSLDFCTFDCMSAWAARWGKKP